LARSVSGPLARFWNQKMPVPIDATDDATLQCLEWCLGPVVSPEEVEQALG